MTRRLDVFGVHADPDLAASRHDARLTVTEHATSPAEATMFLDQLGLLDDAPTVLRGSRPGRPRSRYLTKPVQR